MVLKYNDEYRGVSVNKCSAKNVTSVTLKTSSGIIGTDENNFPHNLLMTDRQFTSQHKVFGNNLLQELTVAASAGDGGINKKV